MADVINDDDDKTLDKSNSGDADSTAGEANIKDDDQAAQGNAGADQGDDQDSSDDSDNADASQAEGSKTRGEVRHERYIDKLASEIRESNSRSTRYTQEIFSPKPYDPIEYKTDEEYDPQALEQDRKQVADNKFAEGVKTGLQQGTQQFANELWVDRFELDSERVTARWDAIEKNPKLEASLVQKYIQFTGMERDEQSGRITIQRPNVRFKDFVEAEMQDREDYASQKAANSQQNIAKQAAQTGVRPTGQSRVTKGDHGFDENDPAGSVARMTQKQYHELGGKEASDAYLRKRGLA